MTTDQQAAPPPQAPTIPQVKIVPDIPVIFADGVSSQSYGFGVSKMYFMRYDPDPRAQNAPTETPVCQLVMPVQTFVTSVAFLEHRLKQMVADKAVTQEQIDAARQYWMDHPPTC